MLFLFIEEVRQQLLSTFCEHSDNQFPYSRPDSNKKKEPPRLPTG